jgi:hypothetical protein
VKLLKLAGYKGDRAFNKASKYVGISFDNHIVTVYTYKRKKSGFVCESDCPSFNCKPDASEIGHWVLRGFEFMED